MEELTNKEIEAAAKELKNRYQREWNRKNKEKRKRHQENYWRNKALKDMGAMKKARRP